MNKLNYEILSAIDNIETTVMESEMNVMNSLIDSYDKVIMVLENCNDINDVSAFDIFQESVIMETDGGNKNKKSLLKKLIELFNKAIEKLKQLFKPLCDKLRKFKEFVKSKLDPFEPIYVMKGFKNVMNDLTKLINEYHNFITDLNTRIKDMNVKDFETLKPKIDEILLSSKNVDEINVRVIEFCDKNEKTDEDFEEIDALEALNMLDKQGKVIQKCMDIEDVLEKDLKSLSSKISCNDNVDGSDEATDTSILLNLLSDLYNTHDKVLLKLSRVFKVLAEMVCSAKTWW